MLKFLIEAFKASKGRMPNNMEMILLRQKAAKQSIDERKVVSMFDRSAINPNKPIMGGKNIPETEDDIRRRLMKQNEEGIASMKKKLNDPEERANGGRIGYKDGEGVITIDDKIDEMISFYKDYLKKGGKMDFKTFSKQYIPENFADGGRIGYKLGAGKKGVQALLDLVRNKFGKKAVTTADKAPIPPKTLERDMFKTADNRINKKEGVFMEDGKTPDYDYYKEILDDAEDSMGFNVAGDETIEELLKREKTLKDYEAEMFAEYKSIGGSKRLGGPNDPMADAIDNASPGYTGDIKYDAQLVADDLAEKMFQMEYDDLTQAQQMDLYDKAYTALSKQRGEFQKISKPEKTLQSMKEGKGIDMSNPGISEEFTRFMKEKDPKGYKELEQKLELSNFKTKGRKENSDGGRIGLFMGSRPTVQKGLSTLKEMLNYFGKKSDSVKNPSDILRIVNPKRLNQMLEDPNIYRKFDIEKGIAAPDLIKNMQKQMMADRQKTIEEMLGSAKNIKRADDNTIKYKNEMIEDMIKKGVDRNMAEEMAGTISKMAENAAGKMDTPKLTDEGIMQLENILKDMETGGKTARELNATGGRIGYKDGPGMNRRTFLKFLGGLASLPIIGKIMKPLKTVKGVKNIPVIKTDNVPGKPEWFDQLVNKVIIEGDDVTKRFAVTERQSIHQKTLNDGSVVRVTEDVDDGAVRVEYENEQNVFGDPVLMEYKKPLPDESMPKGGKPEFTTAESGPVGRQTGPDDFDLDIDEVGGSSIKDLDSDVSKLKEYATGKGPTMKEFIQNKKRKDKASAITNDIDGAASDAVIRRQGDYVPEYDDYASGGIARMLGE